jgi:hypothetical protein
MTTSYVFTIVICLTAVAACRNLDQRPDREPLQWSGWIEEAAVQRGHIRPGDFGQFGCPPGWMGVGDTAAGLRGRQVSATYVGADPQPREGTITCVAQREFAFSTPDPSHGPQRDPSRPLSPVWLTVAPDSVTIGFRQEVPPGAALYIGQDTPCGPRLIGVRLGDLLRWLTDPRSATTRDFLGLVSAGCPDGSIP